MAASYPGSVKVFSTKATNDTIEAAHMNDVQNEISAVETGLLTGIGHDLLPDTNATYDLGSASKKWDNLYVTTLAVKLDDLSAPDDNTDLDATSGAHGLLPKLSGTAANYFHGDGTYATPGSGTASAATPTGTTSATAVMMGLAGSVTPTKGTVLLIIAQFGITNDTNADGVTAQIYTGTGAAPANGDAATGTARGALVSHTNPSGSTYNDKACLVALVTGLTAGTTYWFDLGVKKLTAGTATVTGVVMTAVEV